MKRYINYTIIAGMTLLMWSCADDHTEAGGKPISEITIDGSSIQEEYNLNKNEVLVINPVVTQSIQGKELSYEWEIEHEIYSNAKELNYTCSSLGTYHCRLIVSNEDGKSFFPFVLNVNTPYEEGITIISHSDTGESMLSFMLHNLDGTEDSFYSGDMFRLNNPEVPFASNVSDMLITNGALVLACQGNGTASDPASIYYLNAKTLDIENFVNMPEFPDFKPVKMMVTVVSQPGAAYPVLSEDGKIYEFASTEGTVVNSTKFPSTYSTTGYSFYDGGTGNNFNIYFWDTELGIPVTMDRNSVFYCIDDYSMATSRANVTSYNNIFAAGGDDIIAIFVPQFTSIQLLRGNPDVYFITESGGVLRRTVFDKNIWVYNSNTGRNVFETKQRFNSVGMEEEVPFKPGLPMIASNTNKMLFYGYGNKLYMWPYEQNSLNYATVLTELGTPTTEITAISLSSDQKTLYVASYDPAKSGLNGSCHLVQVQKSSTTDDVTVGDIKNYENVCYKPMKIMYKAK